MAVKTYPYAVVWNGEFVPPETPIEVEENSTEDKPEKKAVKKNDRGTVENTES